MTVILQDVFVYKQTLNLCESETDLSDLMDAFDLREICDTGYGCLLSKISKSSNCSITMEPDPIMALTWSHDMDCTCEECYIGTNGTAVP